MKPFFTKPFVGLGLLLFLISCTIEPKPIAYGTDQCSYCNMNIVSKAYAAQLVTNKGKQFKFDAIECLVNDLKIKNESDFSFLIVSNFESPGKMIDAKTATFVISDKIKSPMGANLIAFKAKEKALEFISKNTGDYFTWDGLKTRLTQNN